jgi:hypothetical protein
MPITLNGTTGIIGPDGSASIPAIQGSDTNTGMFFPAADTIAFAEGGTEVMRIDSSGNLRVGTTSDLSAADRLTVVGGNIAVQRTSGITTFLGDSTQSGYTGTITNHAFAFLTNSTERARIDSSGNLLVGTTSNPNGVLLRLNATNAANSGRAIQTVTDTTGTVNAVFFSNPNGNVGNISVATNSVGYNSTSDYRLKENIAPMSGALARVAALKPVTYKWKSDGSDGQGFIAHELAEVCPDAVSGERDAVDEDGNPVYQGIDTSFLVATLTAAIQEQQAIITSLTARIAALEGAAQ